MGSIKKILAVSLLVALLGVECFAGYPFLIYYGYGAQKSQIEKYKVAVLESENYKDVKSFKNITLGYISIGEVENHRSHYPRVASLGLLGDRNPNWTDSRYVALKGGEWQKIVVYELIPKIIAKGYKGVFLDTVDSLIDSGNDKTEITDFINSVKKTYPFLLVMVNRGFAVLNTLNVDAVLLESTITTLESDTKKHKYQPDFSLEIPTRISAYSCDYWDENDTAGIKNIYKKALEKKYIPIVTDFSLQKLPRVNYDDSKKTYIISR